MNYSEYTKPTVGGASCSYSNLCRYNSGVQMAPGSSKAKVVTGQYIVPAYNAIGYNALTHGGVGSCSGYFNIGSAYGKDAAQCNQAYVTSLCGSCGN